ncbi:ABC transporter permease [Amycolatopsis sp. NPDC049691]|uniref:ABC transporter permease n=1 Tax=Amycolatopsis sp. NPDC049691 TaxID=3155155 RepID=UPI0034185E37
MSGPKRRSGLGPRDLFSEACLSLLAQAGRSALTAAGIVLGCAAFVATLGITATLSHQVSSSFDVTRATEVVVKEPAIASDANTGAATPALPLWQRPVALDRLRRLPGVESAGARVALPEHRLTRSVAAGAGDEQAKVVGADAGALAVIGPHLIQGRAFDAFHDRAGAAVVLLPANLARRLSIDRTGVAVFVDDHAYTVMGIFDDIAREPATLASVVMPFSTAQKLAAGARTRPERDVVAQVSPGAAHVIGTQAPPALLPEAPGQLQPAAPPDALSLRRSVEGDVTTLALLVSLIALGIGTFSIATVATAGVAARSAEIGLRRAIGARPRHIFAQLLTETTLLGAFGGVLGSAAGVVVVVAVDLANGWAPVLDLRTALLAAAGGVVTGLVAGLVPGWRATRIEPVVALRA